MNNTKKCSKCGRNLPLESFSRGKSWCKNCCTTYNSEKRGTLYDKNIVKIERLYKTPLPERILDTERAGIKNVACDECFVQLIDYKRAWISNYGRVLEYNGKKYIFKRLSTGDGGEKICTLQENTYNGKRWVFEKKTVEVWRLVVGAFIVNFDIAGNTHCWHKNNDKSNNFYKNIYPMTEKQYAVVSDKFMRDGTVGEDLIFDILNSILYKDSDWYINKHKRTMYKVGYSGCNNSTSEEAYVKWNNMLTRCYNSTAPHYAKCTVSDEWLNFSNFREWYEKNRTEGKRLDLDKDILISGNTVYSSDTCTIVPHFINTLFEAQGYKTSIKSNDRTGKYDVSVYAGRKIKVGSYDTYEEAKEAYINYKQTYIQSTARKLKGQLPRKTYMAMMNYIGLSVVRCLFFAQILH